MRKTLAGALFLSLALANPLSSLPSEEETAPQSLPNDLGGVIGLLCQFGSLEIRLGDWSFNFCGLVRLFQDFAQNFERFKETLGLAFVDLNAPLVGAERDTGVVAELARQAYDGLRQQSQMNLPAYTLPQKSPGEIYEEAFKTDRSPMEAEDEALREVQESFNEYFRQLERTVAPVEASLADRLQRISALRQDLSRLQDRLRQTPFGSSEAERLVQDIFQRQEDLAQEAKNLANELAYAKSVYTGVQGTALQALRRYDQTVSAIKAKTPTLSAAQSAKKISEKVEEFQKLIEDATAKTQALVEEAQNATSTRAAVQIAVKGIAQLAEGQVVTQSLLYQALTELARQNVYTNQQLAHQTERIANLLGQQVASVAQEATNEVSYTIGQVEAATQTVEGVRRFYKSLYGTRCDWYWRPQECLAVSP